MILDGLEALDKERDSFIEVVRQPQNTRLFVTSTPDILDALKETNLPEVNLEAPSQRGEALINGKTFFKQYLTNIRVIYACSSHGQA